MTQEISRRFLLAGLGLGLTLAPVPVLAQGRAPAALSVQDRALVDRASAYLQSLGQIAGRFTQTDQRGRIARGDFFLKRPGKVRLAYDAPNDLLVVSDGARLSVHDRRLGTFEQYPLSMTPLSVFLAKEIRLDRGVRITEVKTGADGYAITAQDGTRAADGQITLVFNGQPMALREWTVIDAQGGRTRVVLSDLKPVASLDPALFLLRDPRPKSGVARPQ